MAGISFDNIRVGQLYRLINYGDTYEFEVVKKISDINYLLKDIHTLEKYELKDLVQFGKSKDFEVEEL